MPHFLPVFRFSLEKSEIFFTKYPYRNEENKVLNAIKQWEKHADKLWMLVSVPSPGRNYQTILGV